MITIQLEETPEMLAWYAHVKSIRKHADVELFTSTVVMHGWEKAWEEAGLEMPDKLEEDMEHFERGYLWMWENMIQNLDWVLATFAELDVSDSE